jgi:hypothetical protein
MSWSTFVKEPQNHLDHMQNFVKNPGGKIYKTSKKLQNKQKI